MTNIQRYILIAIGLLIAIIQLSWIYDEGLDDSRGWYISLAISAVLLYLGTSKKAPVHIAKEIVSKAIPQTRRSEPQLSPQEEADRYFQKLESEIALAERFLKKEGIYIPLKGNGNSLSWNATLFVYAATYLAMIKAENNIAAVSWNSYKSSLRNLMLSQAGSNNFHNDPKISDINSQFSAIEKNMDKSMKNPERFSRDPIITYLAACNGNAEPEAISSVHIELFLTAERINSELVPEIIHGFG